MSQDKWIGLGVVAVLMMGAYWWVYGSRGIPPIEVMAMDLPGSSLMFSFNDDVTVEEVMVFRPAPGADPGDDLAYIEGEMMWHLVPREESGDDGADASVEDPPANEPVNLIRYGRGLGWLQPAEGLRRRGKPLEVGERYIFVAQLAEGRAQDEFTHVDNGD